MSAALAAASLPVLIARARPALARRSLPAAPAASCRRWAPPASYASPRNPVLVRSAGGMSEAEKAQLATDDGKPTIFDRIVSKEIPAKIVYEDDRVVAFHDVAPVAPTHFLVIPKVRDGLTMLSNATESHKDILGHLMWAAQHTAKELGLSDGYRVVVNNGPNGCQSVYHLHLHVIGGKQLSWPPGV